MNALRLRRIFAVLAGAALAAPAVANDYQVWLRMQDDRAANQRAQDELNRRSLAESMARNYGYSGGSSSALNATSSASGPTVSDDFAQRLAEEAKSRKQLQELQELERNAKLEAQKWEVPGVGLAAAAEAIGRGDWPTAVKLWQWWAERGDPTAQFRLGRAFLRGVPGVKPKPATAFRWFTQAAKQGHAGARAAIGNCYETGRGVRQDFQAAFSVYRALAAEDEVEGEVAMARLYRDGHGVVPDTTRRRMWLVQARTHGWSPLSSEDNWELDRLSSTELCDAFALLGSTREKGGDAGLPVDLTLAYCWFALAADLGPSGKFSSDLDRVGGQLGSGGRAAAEATIAQAYEVGDFQYVFIGQNMYRAIEHWQAAARLGLTSAWHQLGRLYETGLSNSPPDPVMAYVWYAVAGQDSPEDVRDRDRVAAGLPRAKLAEALFRLGRIEEAGNAGKKPDPTGAVRSYRQAADLGHPEAAYRLGLLYEAGDGVGQHYDWALQCYEVALERGQAAAAVRLGRCYELGTGVDEADLDKAREYYLQAVQMGSSAGQLALAESYLKENGSPADRLRGLGWLCAAAANDHPEAALRLAGWYEKAEPTPEARLNAFRWYVVAASRDPAEVPPGANGHCESLARSLTDAQRAEAIYRIALLAELQEAPTIAGIWYEEAADAGSPAGLYGHGLDLIRHGTDPQAVYELWRKAAALGSVAAQTELGRLYASDEKLRDPVEAAAWNWCAGHPLPGRDGLSQNDVARIQRRVAAMTEEGREVPRDVVLACVCWTLLTRSPGNEEAGHHLERLHAALEPPQRLAVLLRLAQFFQEGTGGVTRDPAAALANLRIAAKAGSTEAACKLGRFLLDGSAAHPTPEQVDEGLRWLTTAATQGNIEAELALEEYRANQPAAGQRPNGEANRLAHEAERGRKAADARGPDLAKQPAAVPNLGRWRQAARQGSVAAQRALARWYSSQSDDPEAKWRAYIWNRVLEGTYEDEAETPGEVRYALDAGDLAPARALLLELHVSGLTLRD